nr:MAG TPA: hypothetical protein [Caudoviricetes sp.]DAV95576.1 MAG TPA: hypothetical protein [Caudoviricetes sp.]
MERAAGTAGKLESENEYRRQPTGFDSPRPTKFNN